MPIVKVAGLPSSYATGNFKKVMGDQEAAIIEAVLGIEELELKEKSDVSVMFLMNLLPCEGDELIVEVCGLFEKPKRTKAVRAHLAAALGKTIRTFFPLAHVECFVRPFDQSDGFWSSAGA